MWDWPCECLDEHTRRFSVASGARLLSWGEVLALWTENCEFADEFNSVLADAPWGAFRWETPPLLQKDRERPFEFVLINSPELPRMADPSAFAEHFRGAGNRATVRFSNLGGDAELIVPCPLADQAVYPHLGRFVRAAPQWQIRALWHEVGLAMECRIGDGPVWLSTAGSGVAWLHVRLDERPKYYVHAPYRHSPPSSGH